MKLNTLYIKNYKLLNEFHINFGQDVSILIGINGSGKSSILEAIAWIFRCAHLTLVEGKKENTPFEFEISYTVKLQKTWADMNMKWNEADNIAWNEIDYVGVTLSNIDPEREPFSLVTDNNKFSTEQLINRYGIEKLLPQNVLVYYSGWFETMEFLCRDHEELYKEKLRSIAKSTEKGYDALKPLPMLYIQKYHFDILLATLFSYEFNFELDSFFAELKITKPVTNVIALFIKKREWEKGANEHSFWGAKGLIAHFLTLCRDSSMSQFQYDEKNEKYVFNFHLEYWYKLREEYVEEKKLFYILHMLRASDMLEGIQTFLTKDDIDIDQHKLSEGEQQLITIRGINELLIEPNTLLLFDEPDTYLHPSWQRNFIESVSKFSEPTENRHSQFLITTHSPQLLSNADPSKTEVQIMEEGEIVEITPKYYGKDISTILYEMMGVEGRNLKVAKRLSNLFNLIEDEKLKEAEQELNALSTLLGDDDPAIVRAKMQLDILEDDKDEKN